MAATAAELRTEIREWAMHFVGVVAAREMVLAAGQEEGFARSLSKRGAIEWLLDHAPGDLVLSYTIEQEALAQRMYCGALADDRMPHWTCRKDPGHRDEHRRGHTSWPNDPVD